MSVRTELKTRRLANGELSGFAAVLGADAHLPCAYLPGAETEGLAAMQLHALEAAQAREGAALFGLTLDDTPAGLALCEPLAFDSQFLGMPTGRVSALHGAAGEFGAEQKHHLVAACVYHARVQGWRCMDLQTSLHDLEGASAAAKCGFDLVATNLGIVWDLSTPLPATPVADLKVEIATANDAAEIEAMAAGAIDRYSRFVMDTRLPPAAAPAVFAAWAGNSARGYADLVHTARVNGEVAGYCTWRVVRPAKEHLGFDYARLDLTAVHPEARGRHVLTALARAGLAHWQSNGFRYASVATHALNAGMQRACGGLLGGRTRFARHTFHWHAD